MGGNFRWKLLSLIVLLGLSVYALYPTVRYYTMSEGDRAAMPAEELEALRNDALNLGLDLQGGMHLILDPTAAHRQASGQLALAGYLDEVHELHVLAPTEN